MTGDTEAKIAAAINNAEEVSDPVDEPIEKAANDPEVAKQDGDSGGRGLKQADILIGLAADIGLFHAPDGTSYADLEINGHRETWPIRSRGFKHWLARQFFEAISGAPNSEAMQSALNVIEARAQFDAPQMNINIRVARHDGKLYLDLADEAWRAVEIDEAGWRIVDKPPVRFRRAAGMQPLPEPAEGGSVETLRSFLNVRSDDDFVLVVAWTLAVLQDRGPYPVIVLSGEQGSAKSTFSAILRALLDPNSAPLRALPRGDRDLFIAATNGHVLTFDNVSNLPPWISDTICRLATGGGFAVRQLYTDQDEVLFDAARPVVLNGIEDIVNRPDLADRAIFLTLEPIPEEGRRAEKELWAAFDKACPQILGALLDAVSHGLRQLPDTKLEKLPRMADFAVWATACETALWSAGTFGAAYAGNLDEAVDNVIEADPVGSAVRSLMASRAEWKGTASDLLDDLGREVGETVSRAKNWPATPGALGNRLRRVATFLRKVGIDISFFKKGHARTRTIRISRIPENPPTQPSAPSAPSADRGKGVASKPSNVASLRTVTPPADANDGPADQATVRNNPNDSKGADDADDADTKIRADSGPGQEDGDITGTTPCSYCGKPIKPGDETVPKAD